MLVQQQPVIPFLPGLLRRRAPKRSQSGEEMGSEEQALFSHSTKLFQLKLSRATKTIICQVIPTDKESDECGIWTQCRSTTALKTLPCSTECSFFRATAHSRLSLSCSSDLPCLLRNVTKLSNLSGCTRFGFLFVPADICSHLRNSPCSPPPSSPAELLFAHTKAAVCTTVKDVPIWD